MLHSKCIHPISNNSSKVFKALGQAEETGLANLIVLHTKPDHHSHPASWQSV